jgi:hypothetical protein
VNRGLARSERRRVMPSACESGENGESRVGLTGHTGEDRPKTQGVERSSSSGFHIAKSGAEVAGPGL